MSDSTSRLHGLLFGAAGAVLFSAKAILAKFQYAYGPDSLDVLSLRMLFALPLFVVYGVLAARRLPPVRLSRRQWAVLWLIGLLGYYLSSLLDFWGLEYVPVSLERLILFLSPTFVLLIGALWFGRRVSAAQWLALAIGYAGLLLVLRENLRIEGEHVLFGSALILGAALSYALYLVFSGELIERLGTARLVLAAMTISTLAVLAHYLLLRDWSDLWRWPAEVYLWAAANALFCTFLPVTFTMAAVRRMGSGMASQLSIIGPVSLLFLGWWLLDEVITALQLLGTGVVLVAVLLLGRETARRGPATRKDAPATTPEPPRP
ncbi:DMT family transporter [Pseudomarimonas salicorniae]|uniref:DMT family transporter n=1 Tax=Pseudomarimonas salicorniae TaxID=2933270 RepID=A0ABT0GG37_9GAMM|nr:DMT family transporter [Lysobacter sp. CAU 1642]